MAFLRTVLKSAVAQRLVAEARKPQNQEKVRRAVERAVQSRRGGRRR